MLHVGGELFRAADDVEPNVVLVQRVELEPDVALQQHHQRVDLGPGTLPVLDGERVEREDPDPQSRRRFDDVPHRVDAGPVPFHSRQMTLRGPPPIAVHDDGDVSGQPLEVDVTGQ